MHIAALCLARSRVARSFKISKRPNCTAPTLLAGRTETKGPRKTLGGGSIHAIGGEISRARAHT